MKGALLFRLPSFYIEERDVDFATFEVAVRKSRKTENQRCITGDDILLCFDPGHTTGFAVFRGLELINHGQLTTKPIETAVHEIKRVMDFCDPKIVLMEDYRVYKWKTEHHGGSELLTTRVIGCIETLSVIHFVEHVVKQPAHLGKGFCTNKRLKEWGFYQTSMKHANDAIRHGCHFLLFGAVNSKEALKIRSTVG